MKQQIKVIDSPMGSGKTTALINTLKCEHNDFIEGNKRFIVVTPYLKEIERLLSDLKDYIEVYEPTGISKIKDLIQLMKDNKNIVTTHSAFMLACGHLESNTTKGYQMYIDEIPPLCKVFSFKDEISSCKDFNYTIEEINNYIKIGYVSNDNGHLNFINTSEKLSPRYKSFKYLCNTYDIHVDNGHISMFLNPKVFSMFHEVTLLTYRFKDSDFDYYCQLYKVHTCFYHIHEGAIKSGYKLEHPKGLTRIELLPPVKEFTKPTALSKTWYMENKNTIAMKRLASITRGFFRKNKGNQMWTTFSNYKDAITNRDTKVKAFVACNMKASNEYKDCVNIAYLCNRYMHPSIITVLRDNGIKVNQDAWALSELLQFIYRSNLRVEDKDTPVRILIPSVRMNTLLSNFLVS